MKIQLVSDLHLEFISDHGKSLIKSMHRDVDVLIIAGDIYGPGKEIDGNLRTILQHVCDVYSDSQIIYICGNHEPYNVGISTTHALLGSVSSTIPNLHWLENDVISIGGINFAGCTLWFERTQSSALAQRKLNDFHYIPDIQFAYDCNIESRAFLNSVVDDNTIVITHHAPSMKSVSPAFEGSDLNQFFVCPMDNLIIDKQPLYWLHGHMHDKVNYSIGNTRIVRAPHGYIDMEIFERDSKKYHGHVFEIESKNKVQE